MMTQTNTIDRLAELARDLRDPAIVSDAKRFTATRTEHERLTMLAQLEAEQRAELEAEENTKRQASDAARLDAKRRETIATGTIDADLDAIARDVARVLLDAEARLEQLQAQHVAAYAEASRLGVAGTFKPAPMTGGRQRDGAPTHFPRLPDAIERVRVCIRDGVARAGNPDRERYDRTAFHLLPR